MFQLELLPKVDLERIDSPKGRIYRTPVGDLPSVTSVLNKVSDKTNLKRWKERVGQEEADGVSFQATGRGTEVHRLCENFLLNQDTISDPISMGSFKSIKKILEEFVSVVYGTETMLYSETLWSAGTCDALVKCSNNVNCVVDFKTLRRIPKENSEKIKHYRLQTTVYAMMAEEIYNIEFPYSMVICSVDHEKPVVFPFRNVYYREQVGEIFTRPV